MRKALIIIDIQNDFFSCFALAVKGGEEIIPVINQLMDKFDLVVATQDFHPADHGSFAANHSGKMPGEVIDLYGLDQILWPVHCVQGSEGAAFSTQLKKEKIEKIITKGEDPKIDSYSGFFDNGQRQNTGMAEFLKANEVNEIYVVGLATDYCVKFTALDGASLGFDTYVIKDATRAVNLQPGDYEKALEEMTENGVKVVQSADILSS